MSIFDRVKKLSNQKGISIRMLEQTAGLGNGTIKSWTKSSPTIEKLDKVANVLDVPISELLAEKNPA